MLSLCSLALGVARSAIYGELWVGIHGAAVSSLAAGRPELAPAPLSPPNRDLRLGLEGNVSVGKFAREPLLYLGINPPSRPRENAF